MSKEALAWLRGCPDAAAIRSAPQWAILKELAWKYDERKKYAWPGVNWLADETRLTRRTVQRALADLEELGWIERTFRDGNSTVYGLPKYSNAEARGRHSDAPPRQSDATPAAESRTRGRQRDAQEVDETQLDVATHKVKPLTSGNPPIVTHTSEPATDAQLAYLADLRLIRTGYLVTESERAGWQSMTRAEADAEIKSTDAELRAERPAAIGVPEPLLVHLSDAGRAFYEHLTSREYAA